MHTSRLTESKHYYRGVQVQFDVHLQLPAFICVLTCSAAMINQFSCSKGKIISNYARPMY